MLYNEIPDIVNFVEGYLEKFGRQLQGDEIAEFVKQLQQEIEKMKFSLPEGTTVIAYTGTYNDVALHKTAGAVANVMGDGATYISDLDAGILLLDRGFQESLGKLIGEENIPRICSGYTDDTYKTRYAGGSCGDKGELKNILSLDDFVSKKLMGETVGANSNLIVLAPAGIDGTKVFGATELDAIFKNDTFNTINGIPKAQLQAIYNSKPAGIQAVYDILTATSKEAVGNTSTIVEVIIVNLSAN